MELGAFPETGPGSLALYDSTVPFLCFVVMPNAVKHLKFVSKTKTAKRRSFASLKMTGGWSSRQEGEEKRGQIYLLSRIRRKRRKGRKGDRFIYWQVAPTGQSADGPSQEQRRIGSCGRNREDHAANGDRFIY